MSKGFKGEPKRHCLNALSIPNQKSFAQYQSNSMKGTPSKSQVATQSAMELQRQLEQAQQEKESRGGKKLSVREGAIKGMKTMGDIQEGAIKSFVPGGSAIVEGAKGAGLDVGFYPKQQRRLQRRVEGKDVRGLQLHFLTGKDIGFIERGNHPNGDYFIRIYKSPKSKEVVREFRAKNVDDLEIKVEKWLKREI